LETRRNIVSVEARYIFKFHIASRCEYFSQLLSMKTLPTVSGSSATSCVSDFCSTLYKGLLRNSVYSRYVKCAHVEGLFTKTLYDSFNIGYDKNICLVGGVLYTHDGLLEG
jgi:hypothetical protein